MTDLAMIIGSTLAQDLFGALKYPYRMRVDGNVKSAAKGGNPDFPVAEGEDAEITFLDGDTSSDDDAFEANFDGVLDAIIDAYLDQESGQGLVSADSDAEAHALVAPYAVDESSSRSKSISSIRQRMEDDDEFGQKFSDFASSRFEAGIDWVEAELSKRPDPAMGNPVTLSNLKIAVRARAKACIKVFGRKFCVKATSPWIRFEGKQAAVHFDVDGAKIYGRGQVSKLDFVMTIKILRWRIKVRIGVTGIVNRQLSKQRPLLMDFSSVRVKVPGVGLKYSISSVDMPASGTETRIVLDGQFN
ncbi:hypothetical protein QWY75_09040 [Pontixanthobacter aestiaquae]|uniref:Uncharacterized protein n=1 Tax=Pontixanthobacter aestiaquae TaxID=1509367 RepID=A0A844Z5Y2_9SPHN|nr:hypothetical protein [Pontixanthobacter aestiaquae]MDN3646344.1 hypothetical protein [Pontixanthobacter aestiaquae]MXO82666.1 hypothetical protein [Pontixanthobacter aestiaquae]